MPFLSKAMSKTIRYKHFLYVHVVSCIVRSHDQYPEVITILLIWYKMQTILPHLLLINTTYHFQCLGL